MKTVEQETKETKVEERNPQVSLPSHAPQSNHPEPSPARPTPHISAERVSQSALLEQAAIKSKPASTADSCGAKSTVPPKRSSVKATIACTSLHSSAKGIGMHSAVYSSGRKSECTVVA